MFGAGDAPDGTLPEGEDRDSGAGSSCEAVVNCITAVLDAGNANVEAGTAGVDSGRGGSCVTLKAGVEGGQP